MPMATLILPDAVYAVALDLMGVERPDLLTGCRKKALREEELFEGERPTIEALPLLKPTPVTCIAAALALLMSLEGPFGEDGEFESHGGWTGYDQTAKKTLVLSFRSCYNRAIFHGDKYAWMILYHSEIKNGRRKTRRRGPSGRCPQ